MYFMYEFQIASNCKGWPEAWVKYLADNFVTDIAYLDKFSHIVVNKNRRHFWTAESPKVYVPLNAKTKSHIIRIFNILLNYAKSQKVVIDKLNEDEARARRFAERRERIRRRETWEDQNKDLLNKIDEIAWDMWIDDDK